MSDEQTSGGIRRFGRKDRKKSLDPRGPLFPPEELTPKPAPADEIQETEVEELAEVVTEEPSADETTDPVIGVAKTAKSAPATQPVKHVSYERHILANLLTIVFLLGTVGMGALVVTIAQNPYTPLNPFPPFTPIPIVITATFLPPTALPTGTIEPTATFTPVAVETGGTPQAGYSFILAHEQPVYAPNANEKGCNWSSIAGTVTDKQGRALDGYRVRVSGNGINETVFSGAAITFGAGGFELFLNGTPQAQTYTVQLLDPNSQPLSPPYSVNTQASCDQNVAVLQFTQQ
jgi:hypothetical protein